MAAGKFKAYADAKKYFGDIVWDLDGNSNMKMALFQSTSNCDTLTTGTDVYGDLTNEVANGNGYLTGGVALTNVTWTESSGTLTLDCDNAIWTASGGSIVARFAVIYLNATSNSIVKPLLCVCLLDTTPANITVTTGNSLTIAINASGIMTLSGADSN